MQYNEYYADEWVGYYGTMSQSELARAVAQGDRAFGVLGFVDCETFWTEDGAIAGPSWTSYAICDGEDTFAEARAELDRLNRGGDVEEEEEEEEWTREDWVRGFGTGQDVDPEPDPEPSITSAEFAVRLFNKPSQAKERTRADAIFGYFMCSMIRTSGDFSLGEIYSLDERINRRGNPTYPWVPSSPYSVREYNKVKKWEREMWAGF